jgi:hypothetical protein
MIAFLRSRSIRIRRTRRGLIRVIAYFSVVATALVLFCANRARAEFSNQTLELGRQMAALALAKDHEVTGIRFNGQLISVGSTTTDATPDTVLKNYEQYCRTKSSPLFKEGVGGAGPDDPAGGIKEGFMRIGAPGGKEGAVICFVKGPGSQPTAEAALREFKKTGKLGAIGELRYAYASQSPKGTTLVLTAWTDSQFDIMSIVPPSPDADVPGYEIDEAPRMPKSVRIITARAEGTPYAANVYRTNEKPAEVVAFYDHTMHENGWLTVDPEVPGIVAHGYLKDGVVVSVNCREAEDGTYYALGISGVSARDTLPLTGHP